MPIDDEPAIMMTGFEIVTMKQTLSSCSFSRTITDDTQPGGPVERTIEYHAPFDRCDRKQDYETAWEFFAEHW